MAKEIYDIAVIGGGPAGIMGAIRAGQLKKSVVLIERNDCLGRKILLSGKGRCNVTNIAPMETFVEKFGETGQFLKPALYSFFNKDLINYFEAKGLKMKIERQSRVFPVTDNAQSIVEVLERSLRESNVSVLHNMRLVDLEKKDGLFLLQLEGNKTVSAGKIVLATGGASYKATGSTGDGFRLARKFGHTITALRPALVPLKTRELWVKELQGLTLKNIRITFEYGRKKTSSKVGELLFTHFGVSGPLILDLSKEIVSALENHKEVRLLIDLKPGLRPEQIEKRLLNEFNARGKSQIKNIMKGLLPQKLIPVFIRLSETKPENRGNQITQKERRRIVNLLKALPLTIIGSLRLEEAMVTDGGVSTKEINPRTMESRIVPGLFFAGEIIDGSAPSGGYNLQKAFSTGYLAGEKAGTLE